MTHISSWISPQLAHALGWALLHFLWQGVALAAICYGIMAACRTASARYVMALSTLVLMLAAPVVTFVVLRNSFPAEGTNTSRVAPVPSVATANLPPIAASAPSSPTASPTPPTPLRPDTLLWLVEAWFAGVAFFSLRTAGGLIVVHRMRRNRTRPVAAALLEKCLALERRMRLSRVIRYCECLVLEAPAVIGWFRPVVLLPVTALSGLSEDQLAAVISHELAHIRRLDCFVNLFQIAAETLLFYHPAIWWLNKRIRNERENCCDDAALAVCGNPIEYARALTLMEEWRQRPALAMAANRNPLVERVARLLGVASPQSGVRSTGVAASILCLVGALLAANGLMAAGHSSPTVAGNPYASAQGPAFDVSRRPTASAPSQSASFIVSHHASGETASAAAWRLTKSFASHVVAAAQSAQTQEGQGQGQGAGQGEGQSSSSSSSYVDQLKSQGYDNLSADELISLKVQGVTPEYISQIKALGLHPTIGELISMKVQGIDPQYIKEMRDAGFTSDINQLISMRVQGITPDYVREMRAAGIDGDASKFISFKVQGVTPDYVKEMKATGFNATPSELISMKVQGITPDYVREMRAAGIDGDVNKFIAFKVQGVTPDYVKEMKATGFNATPSELISMKVQGITPDYVGEMRAAGVDGGIREFISFKVQGVTPDYIKEMKAVGVNVDASHLIAMKVQGLDPGYVQEMKAAGVTADTNQLIGMKVQGLTPEYIKEMKAVGVTADTNQLIGMKVQGLDPEYVKGIKATGINASTNQLIGMRVQGVTPEYIKSLQSAGLQNLSAEDSIRARVSDITPEFIKEARSHGFKDLTLDKLIDLRNAGIF